MIYIIKSIFISLSTYTKIYTKNRDVTVWVIEIIWPTLKEIKSNYTKKVYVEKVVGWLAWLVNHNKTHKRVVYIGKPHARILWYRPVTLKRFFQRPSSSSMCLAIRTGSCCFVLWWKHHLSIASSCLWFVHESQLSKDSFMPWKSV